jgi:hypothetical protein
MGADAVMVLQVRRWSAETDPATYPDVDIVNIIERYPIADADGEDPFFDEWEDQGYPVPAGSGGGSVPLINPDWTPTYDLHLAAADMWDEKAAQNVAKFTFAADGASYNRNEVYQACKEQAIIQRSMSDSASTQPRKEQASATEEASIAFEDWESGVEV